MKVFKELIPSLLKSRLLRQKGIEALMQHHQKEVPVVVSLTTFGTRLNKVDIAIRSILNQTYLPQKIVLNVHESYKNKIPQNLKDLYSDRFRIQWTKQDCPHIKLLPTLQNFPDYPIITVDDDVIYPKNLVETLYLQYQQRPNDVISNHIRVIQVYKDGSFKPYKLWPFDGRSANTKLYLALGFGGVLYPPQIFDSEIFNEKLFLQLSPKADDLWFKAMELRNNIKIVPLMQKPGNLLPIAGTQAVSLKANNVKEDGNTKQWQALVDYYNLQLQT